MQFQFQNVNHAFRELVSGIADKSIPVVNESSRAGDVMRIPEPVLVCYERPWERVLFNTGRDCNPFFHLFESLWMFAGRNDVATLKKYNSKIADIASDDGDSFNGAYGYRWRQARHVQGLLDCAASTLEYSNPDYKPVDQLELIIAHLRNDPESRRAVLQMWNVGDDLLKIGGWEGNQIISKDVCCNLSVMFSIRTEIGHIQTPNQYLDMTVTNRSNDLIWGMLGANVVHFSFLQEYVAGKLGINIGKYYHFTNNLHVYSELWNENIGNWLGEYEYRNAHSPAIDYTDSMREHIPIWDQFFDDDLPKFVDSLLHSEQIQLASPFLHMVAWPMKLAFDAHKRRNYGLALDLCCAIMQADWREACTVWITKRKRNWEEKVV